MLSLPWPVSIASRECDRALSCGFNGLASLNCRLGIVGVDDAEARPAANFSTGCSICLVDRVAKAGEPIDLGDGGIERFDLLQMKPKQNTMVTINITRRCDA